MGDPCKEFEAMDEPLMVDMGMATGFVVEKKGAWA